MNPVAMRMATTLTSMLPPREREISSAAGARSGGPGLGDLERITIDRDDVEDLTGFARGIAGDLGVPLRVPVFHARVARALVDPGFERGRLADVQPAHALRRDLVAVAMDPERADDGENSRDDRLCEMGPTRVRDPRTDESRDAQHQEIERARRQLGDDEDEACDQPDEVGIHGRESSFAAMLPQPGSRQSLAINYQSTHPQKETRMSFTLRQVLAFLALLFVTAVGAPGVLAKDEDKHPGRHIVPMVVSIDCFIQGGQEQCIANSPAIPAGKVFVIETVFASGERLSTGNLSVFVGLTTGGHTAGFSLAWVNQGVGVPGFAGRFVMAGPMATRFYADPGTTINVS